MSRDRLVADLTLVLRQGMSTETLLSVKYQPLAMFRVLPVTRCMADMPGALAPPPSWRGAPACCSH